MSDIRHVSRGGAPAGETRAQLAGVGDSFDGKDCAPTQYCRRTRREITKQDRHGTENCVTASGRMQGGAEGKKQSGGESTRGGW